MVVDTKSQDQLRAVSDVTSVLLDVSRATAHYRGQPALEDVSFQVFSGEQIAVVGPNGAGKSTLFKIIVGVLPLASGAIHAPGHASLREIGVAYVPQRSQVDWTFPVTVSDVVMMGRVGRIGLFRRPKATDRERVRWCLKLVGMDELANRQIGELSGGQQQRVFIARALAQEAALLLMDEPLTGLDLLSQEEIFGILNTLREQRVTVMVATHDLDQAADHFDRVLLLNRRMVGIGRPGEIFTAERLAEAYGGHMRLVPTENGLLIVGDTCCAGATNDEPRA